MRIGIVVAMLWATASCGSQGGEGKVNTLPSDDPLYSEMWSLAGMADQLDRMMKATPVDPKAAAALLQRMENTTISLKSKKQKAKHPLLMDEIDSFYDEVKQARVSAEADPPNYYFAGKVSGACVYCHDPDGGVKKR